MSTEADPLQSELAAYEKAKVGSGRTERPLTEAMGRMLSRDDEAAARFVATIQRALGQPVHRRKQLHSKPEHVIFGGLKHGYHERRLDLVFWPADGAFVIIVEAKLDAPVAKKQLAAYQTFPVHGLKGVKKSATVQVALIANRALVPAEKMSRKHWLGATTWSAVLPSLSDLSFKDRDRQGRWDSVLGHYQRSHAFGADPDSDQDVWALLNAVALPSIRNLDVVLGRRGLGARTLPAVDIGTAAVKRTRSGAEMRVEIRTRGKHGWQKHVIRAIGPIDAGQVGIEIASDSRNMSINCDASAEHLGACLTSALKHLAISAGTAVP